MLVITIFVSIYKKKKNKIKLQNVSSLLACKVVKFLTNNFLPLLNGT